MTNLRKPTAEAVAKPDVLLALLMSFFEALQETQKAAQAARVVDLGAQTGDPGAPPSGVVYLYTVSGSLWARTATAPTLLAA